MSQMNNKSSMNENQGSGKIHPITIVEPLNDPNSGFNRMSLDSAHISKGGVEGGSSSNRPLLGQIFEVSNKKSPSILQPMHQTQSIQEGRGRMLENQSNPSKDDMLKVIANQDNGLDNLTEKINVMDHVATEEQQLSRIRPVKFQASLDELQKSLENNTIKEVQKERINYETANHEEYGSLAPQIVRSELPTQPADDLDRLLVNSNLQRNQTDKFIKRKQNVPRRESTQVMKSYIQTINGNSHIKNELSMKNNKGRRGGMVGQLSTLGYSIQIGDQQKFEDNNSTDSDLENQSQWKKFLHLVSNSFHLTSVIPFNSKFRMYWDFIIITLGLWVCFTTPLDVAFEPISFKQRKFIIFNEFIDVLFIIDIIFNFRTTISNFITGDEIKDSKTIALKYLKGQFIIDLIAAIPMDLIIGVDNRLDIQIEVPNTHRILYGSAAAASAQIPLNSTSFAGGIGYETSASSISVEVLNILSILKIARLLRFTKIIAFLNTSESVKLSLRLFKLIFYLMIYIHWQACAWFYYTKWDRMWLPLIDIIKQDNHFYDHGVVFTYCFSIWHSVSILDGDDMVPANSHQAIVVSVLIIISEFIHAHIIGTMDVVLHSLSSKSVHFQEKIEFVTTTMKSIRLNQEVQQKILSYVSKVHSLDDQREHLNKMMETLSPSLQNLITRHMFMNIISDHPVFKSLPELFEFLVESIEAVQYQPEQFIFKEGSKPTHFYILEDGQCEVLVKGPVLKKEIFVKDIDPGSIFGEVALINGLRRTASVRSKVHCTVGAITEESFFELIRYFPEVKNRMKEQCRKYNDHWKDYQINVLANIHYLRNVPYNVREDLHYKLARENFEPGAKLFNRGQECDCIMIVVNGQVELFVEQREQEYILETVGIGSTIGSYSVLNNSHYEYTARAKNKVTCLVLKRQDLLEAAGEDPFMTEAVDSATQYIVYNEVPLCDYSTLNNKDPIDTHAYTDQMDEAVTPIERFRRAIEKVMVLNRRNEVKVSKLFATIRRLKEERDLKANILGQVQSGIANPENETLGQKLRRGIQNALWNLQKGETKAESETLMTSLKAQFQEKESINIGNIKGVGVGVPLKEFTRMMHMMENMYQDMKLVKKALNIPESQNRRDSQKIDIDQDIGSSYLRNNSHLSPFSHRRQSKNFNGLSPRLNVQDQIEALNKEQAALPIKKNIIALLVNAKIELQKEKILKQQMEKEAESTAQGKRDSQQIKNTKSLFAKQKSVQSSMTYSFKNQDIKRVESMQSPIFQNQNQQFSPNSINVRQVTGDLKQQENSKVGSGRSNLGKHSDKGPLEQASINESVGHQGLNHENYPITRASSVLRKRDPFNNQKQNYNENINQQEIDERKSRNFLASEAYSNNFDVPQISKGASPDIRHHHFTMEDENFQDVMTVPVPQSNIDRQMNRKLKDNDDLDQIPKFEFTQDQPLRQQTGIVILPSQNIQSSPDLKQEIISLKEGKQLKEPNQEEETFLNNEINDRLSLDQIESVKSLNEGQDQGSSDEFIKQNFIAAQAPSRNTLLNNPSQGNDILFRAAGISLA